MVDKKIQKSIILLAAGNSSRMGTPKLRLLFNSNTYFVEQIVRQFIKSGITEIIVVVNKEQAAWIATTIPDLSTVCKIVINPRENSERFYSLQLGLKKIKTNDAVFIHNIDNPFIDNSTLDLLWSNRKEADVIKPVYKGKGGHPVLVSSKVYKCIIQEKNGSFVLSDFFKNFNTKSVFVDNPKILININTPETYKSYFTKL